MMVLPLPMQVDMLLNKETKIEPSSYCGLPFAQQMFFDYLQGIMLQFELMNHKFPN